MLMTNRADKTVSMIVLMVLVCAMTAACGSAAAGDAVQALRGATYLGTLTARTLVTAGASQAKQDRGKGSAQFLNAGGGRSKLIVVGNINRPGDAGFAIEGAFDGRHWVSQSGDVVLAIAPDGRVSGGGVASSNRLRFDGQVTGRRFDLTVDLVTLERNAKGLPAGTRFTFDYALTRQGSARRAAPAAVASSARRRSSDDSDDDKECERIVWQARNIPSFSGAPMQMIQVPVCMD